LNRDIDLVGHIYLSRSMDVAAERFIRLVEVLEQAGVSQHVIAANADLAKRVAVYSSVSIAPATGSAVGAYCLVPRVDVVHAHGEQAGHVGLLLALTRSIPYVTSDAGEEETATWVQQAVLRRSMGRLVICDHLDASQVVRSYRRAVAGWRSKTMLV
jgi:hypothetical protein